MLAESEEQKAVVQWLRAKRIFHYATVNENNTYKQDRRYALIAEGKAKAVGKLKGVSDLTVFLDDKILFIEMKRAPKKLKSGKESVSHTSTSKEQVKFLEKINSFPYAKGKVCFGAKQAIEFIKEEMAG